MPRHLLLFSILFSLSSSAEAPPESVPPPFHRAGNTPIWLPRGAFFGTYLRHGAVTPQARLQWQLTVFEDRKDALALLVEGGLGYAVALPGTAVPGYDVPFDAFHANTIMMGVGYRNQDPGGWHWGFQVTGGPLWYGAQLGNLPDERYLAGLVEGRVHVGYQFGPIVLGVSGGYGEPFSYPRRSVAGLYAGGVLLGFFADWR
jgi:hypothetical protein